MTRSILLACALACSALGAQEVALSFDDGPKLEATPLRSPQARNEALLRHLAEAKLRAAFFVTVSRGADRPEGRALLQALGDGGHLIANHTVTHPDFNAAGTSLEAFEQEVEGCDAVIRTVPGYARFLRFPYLREGATEAKRDGIRAYLRQRDYRIGYVSIDTCDWLIDQRLGEKLAKDPKADLAPWRAYYLEHLRQFSEAYRALAKGIYGREVPHVLLLHHNLLNALFLGDVIRSFRDRGWTLVAPEVAYRDPAYRVEPKVLPVDGSVLDSTAEALGIPLKPFFKGVKSERVVGEECARL